MGVKGYCKICALNPIIIEHLENLLKNEGYRKKPCRPLSYEKIAQVIFLVFDIGLSNKTIGRHFRKCMGLNRVDVWKKWRKGR